VKRFIVLTFLLMGWGYYELSGGADFVPQARPVAVAQVAEPAPVPDSPELGGIEIVTRTAGNVTLAALTEPSAPAADLAVPAADIAAALEQALPPADAIVTPAVAPATPDLQTDLREVTGNRVNLRDGPGRDFTAIDQLTLGTVIAVIGTGAGGWVEIEVIATGQTGWMSADFLTAIDG
jgi:hypothetical protein